jgi:hypothetical protein
LQLAWSSDRNGSVSQHPHTSRFFSTLPVEPQTVAWLAVRRPDRPVKRL